MKKQWTVYMRLQFRTNVTVEAENEEEAKQKADSGVWVDDGMAVAELVDWNAIGNPKEDH